MKTLRKEEKGNVAVSSGYDIMTDTDDLLVVHRYVEESRASTSSVNQYDTIDKNTKCSLRFQVCSKIKAI